ncbi:MAG: acetamidase/formamidase family protein [Acidobacteriaceae bacterium]|nr:acetamidase/formamidase family protein [Acidobacteriaceae bacterium]
MRNAIAILLGCLPALAQNPAGQWMSDTQWFDRHNWQRMVLTLNGDKLAGKYGDAEFDGTFRNGSINATVKRGEGTTKLSGRLEGDRIVGTGKFTEGDFNMELIWDARRLPDHRAPRTHTFEPTVFQHYFSEQIEPVLHIAAGDTVRTWSVDAGGSDSKGVRRTSGGNPLTGPFYIEAAVPGDTLVIHFNRIRLNRDTAISGDLIVNGALNPGYVAQRKPVKDYDSDWKIDREAGFAMLKKPTDKLKDYRVPLAPMLGCVGVAPGIGNQYRSGALGYYGGNMDYNQLREGVTVYLPVNVPGALLFVGDGHAAQGAGELTGDALETSMDIEFTVDVLPGVGLPDPRFENAEYLMASGIAGSVDEAFRGATTNLVRWLEKKYGLNAAEVSSVLGTAMVYEVAEVVDPSVHVVAKVPKSALASLKPVN